MNVQWLANHCELRGGVYYQPGFPTNSEFEKAYITARGKEGRIFSVEDIRLLPDVEPSHRHYREWRIRKKSTGRLLKYLKKRKFRTALDVGCGNGWMSNLLACHCEAMFGIDVNEFELQQATQAFSNARNLHFIYGNVYHEIFDSTDLFDLITLASSIQYFPNLESLVDRLIGMLTENGEIHIIDSPFYSRHHIEQASARSKIHFKNQQTDEMVGYYFHHTLDELKKFDYTLVYAPFSPVNRFMRYLDKASSPFYWIKISR